ncbi:MAG: acyl CoA:acetate/3-ketoacid CoA transferase [Chloroflexota bacterium]
MPSSKLISLAQAAALIPDGATITVSSSSGLNCPDAILQAIGERFQQNQSPQNLTSIHPIAAGDMYGITGIDHLAQPGLLKRAIAGSYPSGPSSMESPKIWQMIHENAIEAYNVPSGILFHMHREAAGKRPGLLTKVGMQTFVDPRLQGACMNERTPNTLVRLVEFDGDEWLYFASIPIDVAIIRGTSADESGNISMEREAAFLGAYDQALAARNCGGLIIAQVQRVVESGSIPPQQVRVPGILVDHVVVVPDQMQTTQTDYDPAMSGEIRRPMDTFDGVEWSADKVIARRAAMALKNGNAVNLGFGISALVPRILLEEGHPEAVTWVIEQGAVGGVPLLGFQFGCASNAQAIVPSPDQFTYFQGGGFDCTMLSFMEIDQHGNVNVSRLAARPHVTAGVGGFIDITAHAKRIVFSGYFTAGGLKLDVGNGRLEIVQDGKVNKFVQQVEHVTFAGTRARQTGQEVLYVTERCVIRLGADGLWVEEIAPGVDLQTHILNRVDFPLHVSDTLKVMDERLFRDEPMGLTLG